MNLIVTQTMMPEPETLKRDSLEIAYLVTSGNDVSHFGPVCRELNRRGNQAYFVLLPNGTHHRRADRRAEQLANHRRIQDLLESLALSCRDELNPLVDVAITTQSAYALRACRNTKLKASYGAPSLKQDAQYSPDKNEGFDGFLAHGELQRMTHADGFSPERIKVIGIPKYDAFFQNRRDTRAARRRLGLPAERLKPIITYLPTWDVPNCTIHSFHDAMLALSDHYTIVIKPHPHTQKSDFKTGELDKLRRITPLVLDACDPTEDAIAVADLLISDVKSGVTTESMYLTQGKTPWIGLTPHPDGSLFDEVVAAGPIVRDPQLLRPAVEHLLRDDRYQEARRDLIRYCYADNSGRAAVDAADAIVELGRMEVISNNFPFAWTKLKRSIRKRATKLFRAA